jgi:hypothetical protein
MYSFLSAVRLSCSQAVVEREATEKGRLASAMESLKVKHLEELQLLEDSYKYCTFTAKQITNLF